MKNFNVFIFCVATTVMGFLTIFSFFAAWALDETGPDIGIIWKIGAAFFYVFRFPTHNLFWSFLDKHEGWGAFLLGLFINYLFYGFVIERVFYFVKRKRKISPSPTNI